VGGKLLVLISKWEHWHLTLDFVSDQPKPEQANSDNRHLSEGHEERWLLPGRFNYRTTLLLSLEVSHPSTQSCAG